MNDIKHDLRVLWIDIWYLISSPFKRLIYGYDERDLWSIGEYTARRVLPALKAFRKKKIAGFPAEGFKNHEEWMETIDEMIFGLQDLLVDDDLNFSRAQKGRELFGKYLGHLWD
jgi:hypothetical protein